jgi:hypothetical protein
MIVWIIVRTLRAAEPGQMSLEISPRDLLGFQYSDEGATTLVMASPHGRDTGFADFATPPDEPRPNGRFHLGENCRPIANVCGLRAPHAIDWHAPRIG